MELEPQPIINILFCAMGAMGGWILNNIRQSVRDLVESDMQLAEKVQKIELLVAGMYVKRDDLDRFSEAIFRKLDKIEEKLDGKVDKS